MKQPSNYLTHQYVLQIQSRAQARKQQPQNGCSQATTSPTDENGVPN